MSNRTFPFSPRSTASLERGDLIAVPGEASVWACLQVVDVKREGPWIADDVRGGSPALARSVTADA
jgi:hypothetical protein